MIPHANQWRRPVPEEPVKRTQYWRPVGARRSISPMIYSGRLWRRNDPRYRRCWFYQQWNIQATYKTQVQENDPCWSVWIRFVRPEYELEVQRQKNVSLNIEIASIRDKVRMKKIFSTCLSFVHAATLPNMYRWWSVSCEAILTNIFRHPFDSRTFLFITT